VVSKSGTYKTSDYWSYAVCLYEMLTGKRPNCACDKKTKQWCPFSQKRQMEEHAIDPEGKLHLDIEYPPDKISPQAKDFLQKLFNPDPAERLGANSIDELKNHEYFADIDWDALAALAVTPPFVPDARTVNANSIGEVGEFNKTAFKAIQITPEDNKMYEDFMYVSPEGVQLELVEALSKMDNPESKNNPANEQKNENAAGCCIIL
jgi:rhodopsin kinase